jgi:phenylpyruvate tautomerase PptA (4-oxalocrotonate tautomerase family)
VAINGPYQTQIEGLVVNEDTYESNKLIKGVTDALIDHVK